MRALVLFLCLVLPIRGAEAAPFSPAFYAFQNGVKFQSVEHGVRTIKDLGYQGDRREVGYQGAVSLQCFNIRIGAGENLSRSMLAWKKHLAASRADAAAPAP